MFGIERNEKTVLLAQWASDVSGSPESARILAEGLIERGWRVASVLASDGVYVGRLRKMGCEVFVIRQSSWLSRSSPSRYLRKAVRDIAATIKFVRLIRQVQPTIVYVNTLNGLAPAVAGRLCRVPVIWHIREMFADAGGEMHPPPFLGKTCAQWVVKLLATHVVAVSKAVMDQTIGTIDESRGSVVYNGLPQDFFRESGLNTCDGDKAIGGRVLIGVPGTLREMKGHEFLIRAAAMVVRTHPTIEFAITGEGAADYFRTLEKLIDSLELGRNIRFVGTVANMVAFLHACDMAVIPSRADPLPRTVMESMASGLPVIATRVGGIPEMVADGETGILVEFGDTRALADALCRLIEDCPLRARLGETAARYARQRFTAKLYQKNLYSIIRRASISGDTSIDCT